MANNTHVGLRDITDEEVDFKSPVDEDLMTRILHNIFKIAAHNDGRPDRQLTGAADGVPTNGGATSVLTVDTLAGGVFERDDQYNGQWLEVTSGPASGLGRLSRFQISDSDESAQTITCDSNFDGENLNVAGMLDGNTWKIMGHTHGGADGEQIAWDDIIGINGFEQENDTLQINAGDFDETISHGLLRTPNYIYVTTLNTYASGRKAIYTAHWTAAQSVVVVNDQFNDVFDSVSTANDWVGRGNGLIPQASNPDLNIVISNVDENSFDISMIGDANVRDLDIMMWFG